MAIQLKRGLKSAWLASMLVLKGGQPGVALDTGEVRYGNGSDVWSDLPDPKVGKGIERVNFLDYVTQDTYNVADDHSAALTAAITAAAGKEVFIPEGYVANLITGVVINNNTPVNLKGKLRCSASTNALLLTRPWGSPIGVTVEQAFQFGAIGTTGELQVSKLELITGAYSQFTAGDAYHVSSNDEYTWFGDDGQTAHPVLAGFLTVLGLGMDMPTVTASPPVEYLMVEGATSGAQGMVQGDIEGAGSSALQILFHKVTGNFIQGENLLAKTTGGVSPYTVNTVVGTAGTLYVVKAGEHFIDDYATSIQIRKMDQTATLKLDVVVESIGDTETTYSTRKEAILIRGQYAAEIKAEIRGAYSKALLVKSCFYGRITPVTVGILPNHTNAPGGAFGYGVSVDGASEGIDIVDPFGRYLRHTFTTNNNYTALWYASGVSDTGISKLYEWGTVKNITIHGGYAQDTTAAPWDVHPGAYNVHFLGTRGIAPAGGGRTASTTPQVFSNRGYGTKWIGCSGTNGGIQDSAYGSPAGHFFTNEAVGCVFENVPKFGFTVPYDGMTDDVSDQFWGTLLLKGCTFSADPDYTDQVGLSLRAMRSIVEDCRLDGFNGPPVLVTTSRSDGTLDFTGLTIDYSRATTLTPIQVDGDAEITLDFAIRSKVGLGSMIQFLDGSSNIGLLPPKRIGAVALPQLFTNDVGASGNVTWRTNEAAIRPVTVVGDSSQTVTPFVTASSYVFNTPLTTTRNLTLSAVAGTMVTGWSLFVKRNAAATSVTGTRYVDVIYNGVTLISLAPDEWAEIKWGGSTLEYYVERHSNTAVVSANTAAIAVNTAAIAGLSGSIIEPGQGGFLGWTMDPANAVGSSAVIVSGTLYGARLWLPKDSTVTNIIMQVGTLGATLTSGQSFAAIYRANGTLVDVTADQSAAWISTGVKTMPLAAGPVVLVAGYYDVCFWSAGTTGPRFVSGATGSYVNMGLAGSASRFFTANAGLTTTAPSTRGTKSASTISLLAGLT